jgi:hypothetical protein
VLYYDDFRLFLEDVFKIYENCILNHSLKLLIVLSLDALNDLLQQIALHFTHHDWETYILFAQSLLKKTLPVEISSLDAWTRSKDLLENNYEAKCFALFVFVGKWQEIFEKFPESITEHVPPPPRRSTLTPSRNWTSSTPSFPSSTPTWSCGRVCGETVSTRT